MQSAYYAQLYLFSVSSVTAAASLLIYPDYYIVFQPLTSLISQVLLQFVPCLVLLLSPCDYLSAFVRFPFFFNKSFDFYFEKQSSLGSS